MSSKWNIKDLKPHPEDKSPMTSDRAFTIAQLICYRASKDCDPEIEEPFRWLAEQIAEVQKAWKERE